MKWKVVLSHRLCQFWTELGKQILLCSLFFLLVVLLPLFVIITVTHLLWLLDYSLLHISNCNSCDFFIEFTTRNEQDTYRRRINEIANSWLWVKCQGFFFCFFSANLKPCKWAMYLQVIDEPDIKFTGETSLEKMNII